MERKKRKGNKILMFLRLYALTKNATRQEKTSAFCNHMIAKYNEKEIWIVIVFPFPKGDKLHVQMWSGLKGSQINFQPGVRMF